MAWGLHLRSALTSRQEVPLVPSIAAFDHSALQINSPSPSPRHSDSRDGSGADFAELLDFQPVVNEPRPPAARPHSRHQPSDGVPSARAADEGRPRPRAEAAKAENDGADDSKAVETGAKADDQTETTAQAGSQTGASSATDGTVSAQPD